MTVILLAAGLSTRMGTNKLLLPFKGKTIIEATLETVLSFTKRVVVVTGHESERIGEAIRAYSITAVYAEEYLKGYAEEYRKGYEEGYLKGYEEGLVLGRNEVKTWIAAT